MIFSRFTPEGLNASQKSNGSHSHHMETQEIQKLQESREPESSKDYKHLYTPLAIFFAGLMIAGAIFATSNSSTPGQLVATAGGETTPVVTQPTGGTPGGNVLAQLTVTNDDHIRGNFNAPVTIIEFSDFECPFCNRFHPTVKQALAEYGDQVRWVYKHFPLSQIHAQAIPAAEASECIAEQAGNDGFWQFGDALFENQSSLGSALYQELAQQIGVNITQFDTCVSERKYKDKVQADYDLGTQVGITGTPGGFVNSTPIRGAIPYAQLKSMIDAELSNI
ncbi:DsbA family protein [Patescibacteria group bacterium]|nr:DsbA family protein [Patescibacteria group bacterium]